MVIEQIDKPALEPVIDIRLVRNHIRTDLDLDDNEHIDDVWVRSAMAAAVQMAESLIGLPINPAQYKIKLDAFPDCILLPKYPVASVDAIEYQDSADVTQAVPVTVWRLRNGQTEDGYLHQIDLRKNQAWPTDVLDDVEVVSVTFTVGWSAPELVVHGILEHIAHMYLYREGDGVVGSQAFLPDNIETKYRQHQHRLGMA